MDFTADEVVRRIAEGEGARLEFKRGLPSPDKVARTLCAFANTKGGLLLVGVDDHGEVQGAPRPREVSDELRAIASFRVEPPLAPQIQVVRVEGRPIVACYVGASLARPHEALLESGERDACVRLGSSTRTAEGAALATLRTGATGAGPRNALERAVLTWLDGRRAGHAPRATVDNFAAAHNVGRVRARRAFVSLERAGRIIGHGAAGGREFALAD
jgi:predicted HTH transcriptional regulator